MHDGSSHPQEAGAVATQPAPRRRAARRSGLARRAVVHIGLNKTGSSTIQFWLKRNAKRLREQGFHVDLLDDRPLPALDMVQAFAMYGLAADKRWRPSRRYAGRFDIRNGTDLRARLDDLMSRAEASLPPPDGGTWIASSEHLGMHLLTTDAIRRQHAWLASRFGQVDYVCYIRDQVGWVASLYAQALKVGSSLSLDQFIAERGTNDYHALARRWTEVVGEEHFHLRLFDDVVRTGDLIADFAAAIGADPAGLSSQPPRNQSTTALRLRAMRVQNMVRARLNRHRLGRWADRLDPVVDLFDRGPKLRLSPRQAERVRELNRASNEALRLWLFPDRPDLFGPPPHREAEPRPGSRP